jgi:hypothetical protein
VETLTSLLILLKRFPLGILKGNAHAFGSLDFRWRCAAEFNAAFCAAWISAEI